MRDLGTISFMVSEQTNSDIVELIRERAGDSRDDADRSRINSPKSRQRGLLDSYKAPFRCPSLTSTISNETLESLIVLGDELKKVRRRLISEGYVIDGKRI